MCSAVVSMSCWVLNSGTLLGTGNVDIGVHFRTFSVCAVCLEIVGIPPFWHEKGFPDFSENPQGGVRGIRTLEPLKTTNTLAGCPYRPLRHDSTVLPFSRRNSMQLYHPFAGKTPYLAKKMRKRWNVKENPCCMHVCALSNRNCRHAGFVR